MSQPSKKKVTKAVARKKGKYKNQDKHRWRKVAAWVIPFVTVPVYFTVAAQGVSGVWLAVFTWIAFFLYLMLMLEWLVWRERSQRKWLRIACALLCVAMGGFGFIWAGRTPQLFLARIPTAPVGSYTANPRGGVFWATYNRGTGDVVTPAQLGLFVEIVNQQGREALIDSYTIEAQNNSGKWFKLIRVDATTSPVFLCFEGGDLHKAKPLDLINGLDRVLKDKAIPAYSTVRGWAFFELPESIRESSPFRITVEDNTGAIAQSTDDRYSPVKDYVQSGDLNLAAGLKDLTGYRFMRYSDLFKERIPN